MRMLVTGGAGFIGCHFVRHALARTDPEILVNYDKLTYAGNLESLGEAREDDRHVFVRGDIADPRQTDRVFSTYAPEVVVHLAAESHVDRSIEDPAPFIRTNVVGTQVLIEAAHRHGVRCFLQVSTDEVYGSLAEGEPGFTEDRLLRPTSPYAASKAAADHLVLAWHRTHGLDVRVTRCSNNYGPGQFPEKFIPLMIKNAMEDRPLPVYGQGRNIRDWIQVEDHCRALSLVLAKGRPGEIYNIGGENQMRNLEVAHSILGILEKPGSLIRLVADRPGHDYRYAMDLTKIEGELGWRPATGFQRGLAETIEWYRNHRDWLDSVTSGEYKSFYQRNYANRLRERKGRDP